MKKFLPSILIVTLILTSCATSPYWGQVVANTRGAVPVQLWSTTANDSFKVECSPATAGGNSFGGNYTYLKDITTSSAPQRDPKNGLTYTVSDTVEIPRNCWRDIERAGIIDPDGARLVTVLRITRNSDGRLVTTFDDKQLECVTAQVGKQKSWLGWVGQNCEDESIGRFRTGNILVKARIF